MGGNKESPRMTIRELCDQSYFDGRGARREGRFNKNANEGTLKVFDFLRALRGRL
jgi:hypothetical protein